MWKNIGTLTIPSFTQQSVFLGGIDVRPYGYSTGYAMPYMYSDAGVTKLMVGSEIGNLYLYDNIDANILGTYNRVDTTLFKINEGTRCAPVFEDITNDGKRDLFIGNQAGGLAFFNSANIYGVGINELNNAESNITIYPNPCHEKLIISINDNTFEEHNIKLIDLLGQELYTSNTFNKTIEIHSLNFSEGIYVVVITSLENNYKKLTKRIRISTDKTYIK